MLGVRRVWRSELGVSGFGARGYALQSTDTSGFVGATKFRMRGFAAQALRSSA